jgi:cytidine deaminase
MKIHKEIVEIIELEKNELNKIDSKLLSKAKEASKKAYAPYSKFKVGASLLLENDEIHTANNQENAAYPSGLCAERIAIFAAKSNAPNSKVLKIAIYVDSEPEDQGMIFPCGSCRQSISEYEYNQDRNIEIITQKKGSNIFKSNSIKNILPSSFNSSDLIG